MCCRKIEMDDTRQQRFGYPEGSLPVPRVCNALNDFSNGTVECHWHPEFQFGLVLKGELEYLVFANAYFEPSKELVLDRGDRKWLEKYREYTFRLYPDFVKNRYVRRMGRKDRLHLWILNTRQYWMMRLLSKARRMRDRIKGR